jgi:hypothetical protein
MMPTARRAARVVLPCGTAAAYYRHRRNGEVPDRACLDAYSKMRAMERAA